MKRFEGKTVMITGASGGIGYATMRAFASEGADIIACGSREKPETVAKWDAVVKDYGAKVFPFYFDLSDDSSIKYGLKEIIAAKKKINTLINCAGIAKFSSMIMTSQTQLKQLFQINYFATVQITQAIAKLMIRNKEGSIINLSSIAGMESTPGNCAYGASKAALSSFTKVASQELSPFGIRVNAVAPGFIDTPMQKSIDYEAIQIGITKQAIKRVGTPEEVASTILFLSSDEASYITGQVIRVDGGM